LANTDTFCPDRIYYLLTVVEPDERLTVPLTDLLQQLDLDDAVLPVVTSTPHEQLVEWDAIVV
jgi:hypothetical protein